MNRFLLYLVLVVSLSLLLSGCAVGPKIVYTETTHYALVDSNMARQTQDDISIDLSPLQDSDYRESYFNQDIEVLVQPLFSESLVRQNTNIYVDYYRNLTAFKVTIYNNTDHILRMGDARIVYINPDSDEPVMALSKEQILSDIPYRVPFYTDLVAHIQNKYPKTPTEVAKGNSLLALTNVTKRLSFMNGFNKEVLPQMKSSGIVLFPIKPEQASQGKISFIDLVSKTDEAGNVLKKVRFDYAVKTFKKYWKKNNQKDKGWVEISKEGYEKGLAKENK